MIHSNKKLFVTDLDGTALGGGFEPYARFPDHFSAFLDRITKKGWEWAINTTWDPEGQWNLVLDSSVQSRPAFLIGEFGRQLIQIKDNKPIPIQPYCSEMENSLRKFTSEKMGPMLSELLREFPPKRLLNWGHLFDYRFFETEEPQKIESFLHRYLMDPTFNVRLGNNSFSGRPAFLGKGRALKELIANHGYSPEYIVCAGDEEADLDMMQFSKYSLCPANASEEVKSYVNASGGIVSSRLYASGIIEGFEKLEQDGVCS